MLKRVSCEKKIEFVITVLVSYGTHLKHKNQNQKTVTIMRKHGNSFILGW